MSEPRAERRKPCIPDTDEREPSGRRLVRSVELVSWEGGQLGANVTLHDGTEHMRRVIVDGDNEALMAKLHDVAPWDGRETH